MFPSEPATKLREHRVNLFRLLINWLHIHIFVLEKVLPVSYVVPASVLLVEALHGAHVFRALFKGQTGLAGCMSVVDVHEGERESQVGGCSFVRLCTPHTPWYDGWAI